MDSPFILMIVALTISLSLFFVALLLPRFIDQMIRLPKIKTQAVLIYKGIRYSDEGLYLYILIFELPTGKRLTFHVKENQFIDYQLGDHGILTYRGNQFLKFHIKY
ncbi:DUF2500 family protein [Tepidibacillus fermentans]|uniref:Uncharacterized protein DUF2500 n=1 Tax=Tepidibacillus fermentans TaxID=1281767 RepID=A0A4R3K5U7_9BACI|nr:DUF2500 family protein [Tepidibacillus fermentans]TCS78224.1 uncharacterized protein DUF2500 [Tepidibacillus fermentans]